MLIPKAVLD